ncbi:MAG: DUF2892 domain-containing protein [Gammaproteobacteria bacterium]
MFYVKNVGTVERIVRTVAGLACLLFVWVNRNGATLPIGAGVGGAMLMLSGLVGFCPMCALFGRKLDR